MDGILVVDKPSGPTSHDICQYFKRTLDVRKVGHAGTLDPLATGVLVILLDGACKLQPIFMGKDKEYQFTLCFGISTDTYDSQGKILKEKPISPNTLEELKKILKDFTGEILQVPPPFSAIKKGGVPLYKLARKGEMILAEPRKIRVDSLEIIDARLPEVTLKARCSSGTYVRSIAHDLGKILGCGAHIKALRRLRSEPFGVEEAVILSHFS